MALVFKVTCFFADSFSNYWLISAIYPVRKRFCKAVHRQFVDFATLIFDLTANPFDFLCDVRHFVRCRDTPFSAISGNVFTLHCIIFIAANQHRRIFTGEFARSDKSVKRTFGTLKVYETPKTFCAFEIKYFYHIELFIKLA